MLCIDSSESTQSHMWGMYALVLSLYFHGFTRAFYAIVVSELGYAPIEAYFTQKLVGESLISQVGIFM